MSDAYNDPKLAINRVYTRGGDAGETSLVGGRRVPKHDPRIAAFGNVDELNAFLGVARQSLVDAAMGGSPELESVSDVMLRVQHELFNLGSMIATLPRDRRPGHQRVTAEDVAALEAEIDRRVAELDPLSSFVLPGGHRVNVDLHVARTVCRRAERACTALGADEDLSEGIAYLNRLSDALFVWSRWATKVVGAGETLWDPNKASSGKR